MKKKIIILIFFAVKLAQAQQPVDFVNPFIGTTNFGTTNPGAVCPNGMMSVVPFNVTGSNENVYDKDLCWWSTPYEYHNKFFTGFSHVNLSGVGCPDMGSLLLMPTCGKIDVDYKKYGSNYENESASPGYYTNFLTKYGIKCEVSATKRTGISRFTFPEGQSNILLNLGEGLTNESGAFVRKVNSREFEGMKLLGTFCYNPQAVFPIYFVIRVSKEPESSGYWKKQRQMQVEAQWDEYSGKYKLYTKYDKEIAGDDIGAYFTFKTRKKEQISVQMGVSFVSIKNARLNLDAEQKTFDFEKVQEAAKNAWNNDLSRILVETDNQNDKIVFYTALYHLLIHPNILQDVNGEYPEMESGKTGITTRNRYTVFSLWDTYRNVHQLLTLAYPKRQAEMVQTMIDMYKEHGWLPKWELYGRETLTMEGDPAIPVIVDTWLKGLRDFDINEAYKAMYKSATTPEAYNLMRPDNDCYMKKGYVPIIDSFDNSVSHALEYYIADYSLSKLAQKLGKLEDAKLFFNRAMGYTHYYCKEYGTLRPILPNGQFYSPFDPMEGENFEPNPGFHEGNAWNYTFYVPFDIKGLAKLMGGKNKFVEKLQMVFDKNIYDPANEPDIAYPYLFSYFKGEEWRTQKEVHRLLQKYFTIQPNGIPGNDDAGTMSAWAIFSMMGFYPDCPGTPEYTITSPKFDRITIKFDEKYYKNSKLIIETKRKSPESIFIDKLIIDGKKINKYRLSHNEIVNAKSIVFYLK